MSQIKNFVNKKNVNKNKYLINGELSDFLIKINYQTNE